MKVSVVMPIRNAESTLKRSIDSVLNQTFEEFELVCVINDCIDTSEEIIKKYSKLDNRVRLFESEKGIVPALNCGIKNSNFDLIARQDADDYWHVSKLEKQVLFLEENKDIDILGSQIRTVDENYNLIKSKEKRPINDLNIKMSLINGWNCMAHPSIIFKKNIMNKLGGYDDTFPFAEDYSLWLRAIKWYKFSNFDEELIDYTVKHNHSYDPNVPRFLSSIFRTLYGVK